ncbi:MAG: hypothetical protein SH819_08270 [Cytophagales bacterium]|nr:hypothetical protein [Cytophagales bacterium]
MIRALVVVALFALFGACTKRLVCPAYQSSFIYDKDIARQKFSYFKLDSTPKVYTASKTKYLIAVPESYRKKYRKMQTVEMIPVYPVIADSIKEANEFLQAEGGPVVDSAAMAKIEPGDSAYAITKTKERYNLDQDLYMWYFREFLVLPDVRAALAKKSEDKNAVAGTKKEKGGFFKNLFKKKPKNDSTSVVSPSESSAGADVPEEPKKKKGGLFKKKEAPPAKKEEGDGF